MKKFQYKDQYNKKVRVVLTVFLVLVFILFLTMFKLNAIKNSSGNSNGELEKNKTIKQIVIEYGNKYIDEKISDEIGYEKNIYVELNKLPYENDISNETYYMNFLTDIAKVLYFNNFYMIDEKNKYEIEVICKDKKIYSININGIEDYFNYMDFQISMNNYVEMPETEITIDSPIVQELVNNGWSKDTQLGSRESIFDNYYVYFEEGIKARIIQNNIYNIVFDKRYNANVVNNMFPGIDLNSVETKLGKATFKDKENKVIGYKNKFLYVFFTENEISLYRNLDTNIDDFYPLLNEFVNKSIDLKEFMNELTYIWPDYSEYQYSSNSVFLSYPLKGIEIKLNYDDISGILVYNNIKSILPKVKQHMNNSDFIGRLKLDSVFEAEKRRVNKNNQLLVKTEEYKKSLSKEERAKIGESFIYEIYPEISKTGSISKMNFIARKSDAPNRELNDRIDDFLWATNEIFIYSKENKGINLYDLRTGINRIVVQGDNKYNLIECKDNILKYDNKQVTISY